MHSAVRVGLFSLILIAVGCRSTPTPDTTVLMIADPAVYATQRAAAIQEYGSVDAALAATSVRGSDCDGDGPVFDLVAPDLSKSLSPGFPIDMRWHARSSGAHVVPEKTKISYKFLVWTDVTDRVRTYLLSVPNAVLDENGLKVPSSSFPGSGTHRLKVVIFDSNNKCTSEEMTLRVAG